MGRYVLRRLGLVRTHEWLHEKGYLAVGEQSSDVEDPATADD